MFKVGKVLRKNFIVIDTPTSTQLVPVETINSVRELLKREEDLDA